MSNLDELLREYAQAVMLAQIFGERFWKWEQKRTRLLDQLENEISGDTNDQLDELTSE